MGAGKGVLTDVQLGAIAVSLALEFPDWIERRVEQLNYLDPTATTRWDVGVMFRWREQAFFQAASRPNTKDQVYVPLDLLTKNALFGLDGQRPDGSPVPILPYARSTRLAYLGLASIAWNQAEEKQLPRPGRTAMKAIEAIIKAPPKLALPLFEAMFDETDGELSRILAPNHPARWLLRELADDVMLLVPAVYQAGEEAVYRYTYHARAQKEEPIATRMWDRVRFRDVTVKHPELSIGRSSSYHLLTRAPSEASIPRATLYGTYQTAHRAVTTLVARSAGSDAIDLHARRPTRGDLARANAREQTTASPALSARDTNRTRLKAARSAEASPTRRDDKGSAWISLGLKPSGTFLVTTVISTLTAALLGVVACRLKELDGQTGAALLLALPLLTLGYMTKPDEHLFVTRLLKGIRVAALAVGLCALWVAAIIAGGFIQHRGPTIPRYTCEASTVDIKIRAAAHSWRTTPDPDEARAECHAPPGTPEKTDVSEFAVISTLVASSIAGALTLWLIVGLFCTSRRARRLAVG